MSNKIVIKYRQNQKTTTNVKR